MTYVAAISPITLDIIHSGLSKIPNLGEEVFGNACDMQIGGGPPATLIVLNKLGIQGELGTFLGRDNVSLFTQSLLTKHNVSYTNLYRGDKNPVVVTSIASYPEDRYFLTYNPGIDERMLTDGEVYGLLHGSKVCFGVKGHNHVMSRLKEEGTKIVYDVGWQDDLHIDQVKDILNSVFVFTPNDKEAMKMTGKANVYEALEVLGKYADHVIITMGKEGSITKTDKGFVHIPAVLDFETLDTTGAGDNFLAGVMFGLYKDLEIEDCMKIGNVVGGFSTTELGCCKTNITIDKLEYCLRKYYGFKGFSGS